MNIQNRWLVIKLNEIENIKKTKIIGLIPDAIRITTIKKNTHKFGVDSPNEWIRKINESKKTLQE